MPRKIPPLRQLTIRSNSYVPLIDAPPLGHLQLEVLILLDQLGDEASGSAVLERLSAEAKTWIDHAKVFSTIRALQADDKAFIKFHCTRRSEAGGPPLKIYKVTDDGRAAIERTMAHFTAVAGFCEKYRRRRK